MDNDRYTSRVKVRRFKDRRDPCSNNWELDPCNATENYCCIYKASVVLLLRLLRPLTKFWRVWFPVRSAPTFYLLHVWSMLLPTLRSQCRRASPEAECTLVIDATISTSSGTLLFNSYQVVYCYSIHMN